ncbi:MAG: putative Ig domain-containing protein [Acidobacteriota bacterium]
MTGLLDNGFQWYPVDALGHAFRHGQFPQIAVSPQSPSTVYMTWNHADPGNPAWDTTYVANCCNGASTPRTFNAGDIAFARSTDGGQTWTAPKRLDDDPPLNAKDQWFPALTVSGNGTIHASWYDRRDDPANVLFHVYHTSSTDGGLTWTPNVRVSDVPSDPAHLLYGGQAANLGDYGGMAANDQRVVCVWLDARTGTPAGELRMYADTGAIGTSCGTIVLAPATLPVGTQGTPYGATLTASGGSAPYTFAVTSGSLPAGLSLSAAGVISGTPSAAGSSGVTITATDAAGCTGSHPYTITINPAGCGTIAIAPASLPSGTVGVPYSQQLTASGGTAPYGYAVTSGALPAGLTLSASGLVSGTPSAGGASSFVVEATDAAGCKGTKPYTITIGRIVDDLTGQGLGPPNPSRVRVFTGSGAATTVDFLAYAASQWGVNVAASAVSPGTYDEILTAPGPGPVYGPQVRGFQRDGTALAKLNYYAYGTLKYGANVAAADVDGDTLAEILTGAGPGAVFGPHVRGWNFDGGPLAAIAKISFFAYGTLKFGVNVSGGALDADVYDEILTGPGPGVIFGPQVRGFNFDGASVAAMAKVNFNAFATPQYGASVSGGDVDADGYAEIAAAPGPGPTLPSRFAGFDYDGVAITNLPGYDVTPFATFHGGRLGIGDVTPPGADGRAELLASPGRDATAASTVATYAYNGAALVIATPSFSPFPGSTYGNNVAGAELGY